MTFIYYHIIIHADKYFYLRLSISWYTISNYAIFKKLILIYTIMDFKFT